MPGCRAFLPRSALAPRSPPTMRHLLAAATIAALVVLPATGHAQKEPKRPRLESGADTNDARAYFDFGVSRLDRDPDEAADAFYWAARINPLYADAFYGRRVALLMTDKRRLARYMNDDRRTLQSDDVRRIDSLYLHALTLNPFLSQRLDKFMFDQMIRDWAEEYARNNDITATEVQYYIERQIQSDASVGFRAWRAYSDGDYDQALSLYAKAIAAAKYKAGLRTDRGRLFFQLDRGDSALAELTAALDEMRKSDKKELVYVYQSKALLEQSIGMIQYRLGNVAAAKESFGRALEEDLSYAPAHVQLAYIALEAKDTATAVNEMDLAVQLRGDDPAMRYIYGYTLASVKKLKEAEEQLLKARDLDPVFALPYHALGEVYQATNRPAEALAAYNAYVARAGAHDAQRDDTIDRVKTLGAMQQGAPAKP